MDWKLNQLMSPADLSCEKGYVDLRYTSKHSRDKTENMNAWKMEHSKRFTFSTISRDPFDVQQRSIYPFSQRKKTGDILPCFFKVANVTRLIQDNKYMDRHIFLFLYKPCYISNFKTNKAVKAYLRFFKLKVMLKCAVDCGTIIFQTSNS